MSAIIISGRDLAKDILSEVAEEIKARKIHPCLVVCTVAADPASVLYVQKKQEACESVGIRCVVMSYNNEVTTSDLRKNIFRMCDSDARHGVIVQLPLPSHINTMEVSEQVWADKDVDGFTSENLGRLMQGRPYFVPPTPAGIDLLLERYKVPVVGKHVVIINDTIVVGKPLSMLMQIRGATVTLCNSKTENLSLIARSADILVSAVGKQPYFHVTTDMVKPGAAVIDVGISRIDGKTVGDVGMEVREVAGWITPAVGGVGPMTVAMLLRNVLKAATCNFWGYH